MHIQGDAVRLALDLAQRVATALCAGLASRGVAALWVSGGSTPVPFFQALSRCKLDWSRVHIGLVDERWCAPNEADSNEHLVRTHLLQHAAAQARWLGLYRPEAASAVAVEVELNAALDACPWPADVVVLGMGGDGHTASWFPETPECAQAMRPAERPRGLAVSAPGLPNVPRPRFTLTLGAVRDTRLLCLHTTGQAKADLLGRVWAGQHAAQHAALPVAALWATPMPDGQPMPPVEVYWSP